MPESWHWRSWAGDSQPGVTSKSVMRKVGDYLGTTQTQDWVLLGLIVLAGYVVFEVVKGVRATGQAAAAAGTALYHGAQTVSARATPG